MEWWHSNRKGECQNGMKQQGSEDREENEARPVRTTVISERFMTQGKRSLFVMESPSSKLTGGAPEGGFCPMGSPSGSLKGAGSMTKRNRLDRVINSERSKTLEDSFGNRSSFLEWNPLFHKGLNEFLLILILYRNNEILKNWLKPLIQLELNRFFSVDGKKLLW